LSAAGNLPMNAHALDTHAGPRARSASRSARLAGPNVHPPTGLATDYLKRFNEAIMMLEPIPSMPAGIDDLLGWNVMTDREHLAVDALVERRS
jgi:hypothetical protein